MEFEKMKTTFLKTLLFTSIFFTMVHYVSSEERPPQKTLTLLYSNNINGEIDPCPT